MVVHADTVIYPGAVMVKSFYTAVANSAVLAAGCAQNFTFWAHLTRMYLGQDFHEFELRTNEPRLFYSGHGKRNSKYY